MRRLILTLLSIVASLTASADEAPKFRVEVMAGAPLYLQKTSPSVWAGRQAHLPPGEIEHSIAATAPQSSNWNEMSFSFTAEDACDATLTLCGSYEKANGKLLPFGSYIDEVKINGELIPNGDFDNGLDGWMHRTLGSAPAARIICDPGIVKFGKACAEVSFAGALSRKLNLKKNVSYEISIRFRFAGSLVIREDVSPLDLAAAANMAFADAVAGDGKGGWTDRGPGDDMAGLDPHIASYGGMEFAIVDPAKNGGKSIMTFAAEQFPNGLKDASIDLEGKNVQGRYLYLLHTASFAHSENTPEIGRMDAVLSNGKRIEIPVRVGIDVDDWWKYSFLPNASPVYAKDNDGSRVCIFLSRFELPDAGCLKKLSFRGNGSAIWIVVGASVSNHFVELASCAEKYSFAPSCWKIADIQGLAVTPGSALDLSNLNAGPAGSHGRPFITTEGLLAFKDQPKSPLRFFGFNYYGASSLYRGNRQRSHETVDRFASAACAQGYNLTRVMSLDTFLCHGASEDLSVDLEKMDTADYLFAKLKDQGLYSFLTVGSYGLGYKDCGWAMRERTNLKLAFLLGGKDVRAHWRGVAESLLKHVNPYTGLAWKDDPSIICLEFYNELLAGSTYFKNASGEAANLLDARFREAMEAKYGAVDKLNAAWKTNFANFADPALSPCKVKQGLAPQKDIDDFFDACARESVAWMEKTVRACGYEGLVAQFNFTNDLRSGCLRSDTVDVVIKNGYFQHPSIFSSSGSKLAQNSSVEQRAGYFLDFAGSRLVDRPFMVTEHNHSFWNQYQHEDGVLFGAYASLQNFSAVMIHENPVTLDATLPLRDFSVGNNPVARANEFAAACFYRRGDVKASPKRILLQIPSSSLSSSGAVMRQQSRAALVAGFGINFPYGKGRPLAGTPPSDFSIDAVGMSEIASSEWFSNVKTSNSKDYSEADLFAALRRARVIDEKNISDPSRGIYQSDTGEILMRAEEGIIQVATPFSEAVVLKKNGSAKIGRLVVLGTSVPASIGVFSVDGKPLKESRRMVVAYSTCAANTAMDLSGDRTTLRHLGTLPALLETGRLNVELSVDDPKGWSLYPLSLDGSRRKALPVGSEKDTLALAIDTATLPEGPTVFFELEK